VTAAERRIIARRRCMVAHNPTSNMNNAVGVANLLGFLKDGVTVGLGTATIVVGADTASNHSAFVAAGCERMDTPDCRRRSRDGSDEQLVTNLLLGGTLVAAAALLPNGGWAGVSASF
jgi:hypothetical protein